MVSVKAEIVFPEIFAGLVTAVDVYAIPIKAGVPAVPVAILFDVSLLIVLPLITELPVVTDIPTMVFPETDAL